MYAALPLDTLICQQTVYRAGRDAAKTYITEANILNDRRVDLATHQNILEQRVDHVVELGIFHAALDSLAQRRADGEGDNNVVWVLLQTGTESVTDAPLQTRVLTSCRGHSWPG
jgi:hypothetical protein